MEPPELLLDVAIEPLVKSHVVRDFDCENGDINQHIHRFAKKNTVAGFGRAYVLVKPGHSRVWAYYTLAAYSIDASEFHSLDNCPQKVSVALLGRFGVDKVLKKQGYGDRLMADVFSRALDAADVIGIHAVFLNAKNRKLASHYSKYGFMSLPDNILNMSIAIKTLRSAE